MADTVKQRDEKPDKVTVSRADLAKALEFAWRRVPAGSLDPAVDSVRRLRADLEAGR